MGATITLPGGVQIYYKSRDSTAKSTNSGCWVSPLRAIISSSLCFVRLILLHSLRGRELKEAAAVLIFRQGKASKVLKGAPPQGIFLHSIQPQ
ncbi:MAG: hypothetical protein LBF43_03985 [Puniceicoccales bacterium]|nr:hypothetical protein [Puniceicoccales bacterium]